MNTEIACLLDILKTIEVFPNYKIRIADVLWYGLMIAVCTSEAAEVRNLKRSRNHCVPKEKYDFRSFLGTSKLPSQLA